MRRFLIILLTAINCISISAQKKQTNYNLLWKIDGNQLTEPSFLFGTMHVSDKRAFNYSDSVMLAIDDVDAFALEVQPDEMVSALFSEMFTSTDTTNLIKKILTAEEYEQFAKRIENELNMPIDKLNLSNPLLIEMMLERSDREILGDSIKLGFGEDKSTFVDAYLYGIAKTLKKQIYGLEKIEDHLDIFTNISKEEQRKSLLRSIDTTAGKRLMEKLMEEQMIKIYNEGNVDKIEQFIGKKSIDDPVMVKRNKVMAASIDSILQNQSLFAAIGAAHLPGNEGVIKLLEAKGYQLKPIKATFTGVADNYTIDYTNLPWETHTDSDGGFSIETPSKLFEFNMFEEMGMDVLFTWEMTSGAYYGIFKMPMPIEMQTSAEMEDAFYKNIAMGFVGEGNDLISNEVIETPDGKAAEIVYTESNNSAQKMRFFLRYGKMTAIFMGNSLDVINQPYADRFFNSFKSFEPENYEPPTPLTATFDAANWVDYTNDEFAFSVKLPNLKFENQTRELDIEGSTEKYVINMFFATDTITQANYFVRYNNFPLGMYAQTNALEETLSQILSQADETGEIDTIWHNGYEGRSFNVKVKGFPLAGQVFLRGNRVYAMLKQNYLLIDQKEAGQYFFDSFKMESFQQDTFQTVQSDTFFYKIEVPSVHEVNNSTSFENNTYFGFEADHTLYGKNPYTGATYVFGVSKFNDLYRIQNMDSFLNQISYNAIEYSDTIIKKIDIEKNGNKGTEYHISPKNKQLVYRRLQLFLDEQYLYQLDIYDSKEELFGDNVENFFNSFEIFEKPHYNIQSTKTDVILKGLHSTNEQTYKKSLYALTNYYKFNDEDIKPLLNAVKQTYKADTNYNKIASSIFDNLQPLLTKDDTPELIQLYRFYKDSTYLMSDILYTINEIDSINGYETYFNLFIDETPYESNYYTYAPLNDSLPFVADHFTEVLSLLKNDKHRPYILDISNTLYQYKDGQYKNKVEKHLPIILEYAMKDGENYKSKSEDFNYWKLLDYLPLIEAAKDKKLGKKFTKSILQNETPNWVKLKLTEYSLKNNLKIKPSIIDSLLADKPTKLQTIKALYKAGKTKQIDKQDLAIDAFTKLAFNTYVYNYDDYFADTVTLTGKLNEKEGIYYVYQFGYEGEDEKYIGITGPFQSEAINFKYHCKTNWDELEEDWQTQAKALLTELQEDAKLLPITE